MSKRLVDIIKDDRKYLAIVFFILVILIATGILSPILIENQRENWAATLSEKIADIESKIVNEFHEHEKLLIRTKDYVRNDLHEILDIKKVSYGDIVKAINLPKNKGYSLEVLAPNGKLIAWNSKVAVPQEDLFPLDYPIGETYFVRSDLVTYLTITDTIVTESDIFYIICSLPFEKHYTINNEFYEEISFTKRISEEYGVHTYIDFDPLGQPEKDGRKYSFPLLNNRRNIIGKVTFTKPILDLTINRLNSQFKIFQSILVTLAIIFFGFGLKQDYLRIKYNSAKIVLLAFYLLVFRYIIYQLEFPSSILPGILSDASYFSSAFAGGWVRSPIEFLITAIFFAILCLKIYHYSTNYFLNGSDEKLKVFSKFFFLIFIPLTIIYFLGLRGLSASIKSVIFDSTLRYFRDPNIIPDLPTLVMNLNVLLLGSSVVLILIVTIICIISSLKPVINTSTQKIFLFLFLIFQIFGIIFIEIQKQPLINISIIVFLNVLVFALAYYIYFKGKNSKYTYVYAALVGAVITIVQMNYFNTELEKEALKIAAVEINRPNDNLFKFLISEILLNSVRDENVISAFTKRNINFSAEAYSLWCKSSLQREALKSSVAFWDIKGEILGQFWIGDKKSYPKIKSTISLIKNDPVLFEDKDSTQSSEIIITGVAPIFINNKIQGYISASVFWDPNLLVVSKVPEYLQSRVSLYNSVVDFSQLKIFQFNDSKLVNVYGDIYPSREQVLPITSHNFSSSDDAWFVLDLNEEKYITYALKHNNDNKVSITAVSFLEQKISWSLFNFFKLFIIQSIFIVTLLIVLFLADIKNFNYTFKFQLTIAFLLISLIPVVVFGLYNRQLVEKRTDEAIQNELRERTNYVENYIRTNLNTQNEKDLNQIFEDAGNKLGISFSVFENGNRIFNSNVQYFNAGIFQTRINPVIYYNLNYLSFLEYRIKEAIERFAFNSYYKKVIINGRNYILSVDDLFNKVNLTLSPSDFDVLLFGIYLLAALIIILISTILADKISSPIRRLTKATLSVAQGDLSISLPNQQKGELRDLFNGFNLMTDELKRNQTELAELEREAAWKEMAKQVAHEIKNPLTPMKLSMQQLVALYNEKNKNFEQIFEKLSATILNQIESLSSIASEFSRFAKMPSYKNEQVDLPSIVRDVVNLFTDEQVTIKIETSVKNFTIMADNAQVRRLLINLIRNSIQAGANEIKLFIYCESDFCNLLVKDNGHGIQHENQDKIFDQNFTTKAAGMGLGLKLAKRFLGVIGGDIELVESNQISTTFRVKFPVLNKE